MGKVIAGAGMLTVVFASFAILFGGLNDSEEETGFYAIMIGFAVSGLVGAFSGLSGWMSYYKNR